MNKKCACVLSLLALTGLIRPEAGAATNGSTGTKVYVVDQSQSELWRLLEDFRTENTSDALPVITKVDALATGRILKPTTTIRTFKSEGAIVDVYCIFPSDSGCAVKFDEKEREARIVTDLRTLLKGVQKQSSGAAPVPPALVVTSYRLVEDRATLEITAGDVEDGSAKLASKIEGDDRIAVIVDLRETGTPLIGKATLLTGSSEHWFLSADIPVNKASVLKFDDETNTLVEREKPSEFHVGFNYSFEDVVLPPNSLWQAVFVKVLLTPSSKPLESFGAGLGLRGRKIKKVDLSPLTAFVAYTWTESDEVDEEGRANPGGDREGEWRFGVGFNLSRALDWLD